MFCRTCGKEIHNEAVICPHCGCATSQKFFSNQTQTQAPAPAPQPAPKKPSNGMCIAGFVVGLVSLFFPDFGDLGITALCVGATGLVLSILGMINARKKNQSKWGLGVTGFVLSLVTIVGVVISLISRFTGLPIG